MSYYGRIIPLEEIESYDGEIVYIRHDQNQEPATIEKRILIKSLAKGTISRENLEIREVPLEFARQHGWLEWD